MKTSAGTYFRKNFGHTSLYWLMAITFITVNACGSPRYIRYDEGHKETGYAVASWYGPGFHGKPTASGKTYDMHDMTCAHKTLPFGTRLRITNPANDRSVDVVVNDRGPFIAGRDIDLSYGAAKEIGVIGPGTARVKVEHIGRDQNYIKTVSYSTKGTGPFTIQVGSFKEIDNASRLKDALELKYISVYITKVEIDGQEYYRVRIGRFPNKQSAYRNAKVLAEEGYNTLITHYDEQI